jgi:hypothetical protein
VTGIEKKEFEKMLEGDMVGLIASLVSNNE